MPIQAVRFDRKKWTPREAEEWLRQRGLRPIKPVDVTKGQLRYRLAPPGAFARMATHALTRKGGEKVGVSFVLGY